MAEQHIFCFYWSELSMYNDAQDIICSDQDLIRRIVHVTRLKPSQSFMMFDRFEHAQVMLISIYSKSIILNKVHATLTKNSMPGITLYLPILKKHALEQAVYSAAELGASSIVLFDSKKSLQTITNHELQRLDKIVIAAAEQSKNYAYPSIIYSHLFSKDTAIVFWAPHNYILFLDPTGQTFHQLSSSFDRKKDSSYALILGPEADLTHHEKSILSAHNAIFMRLTTTTLRACQASALGLGLLRSWLTDESSC